MLSAQQMRQELVAKASEDTEFRARLISSPKVVINEEYSLEIPEAFEIQVHEDGPTSAHLVLGPSSQLTDDDLRAAHGGWHTSDYFALDL